jgi:hypothetical protein
MSKVRGLAGGQRLTDTVESRDVLESKSFVSISTLRSDGWTYLVTTKSTPSGLIVRRRNLELRGSIGDES